MTNIISNGSKWAGEKPDSIEKLIQVLNNETIEERFFETWIDRDNPNDHKLINFNPISKTENKKLTKFFGNFEAVSHVFNIETDEKEIIEKLSKGIQNNEGWKKYYHKNYLTFQTHNGYKIRFNDYWSEWQTSHPKIGVTESFKTFHEAKEYCFKG